MYKIIYYLLFVILFTSNKAASSDIAAPIFDDSQVAKIEITIDPDALAWIYDWDNRKSDSLHISQVHFSNALLDETIDSVGFRLRGNTSRDAQKKSFKLSFNTFTGGREFYGLDKLNLNGEHNDPSVIRSKLCWDFFQKIGMTASRAAHAAVYINGDYYGLYIMIEHIDDEFVDMHFDDGSGNLWKCLWPADLTFRGTAPSNYYPYHDDTRPYELKTNKEAYDYSQLARLITLLNTTPIEQLEDSLETILKVPEVLKYFAMNILTGSWDDYWSLMNNYYLYHEPLIDKFQLIPYDYDNSFGIDWFNIDWTQSNPYQFDKVGDGERPLAERLMAIERYKDLYTHFLSFYAENVVSLSNWEERLDSLKSRIRPWVIYDPYYPLDYGFSIIDFDQSFSASGYARDHVKFGLKEFINRRIESLNSQLSWEDGGPIIYSINWSGNDADSLLIEASAFSAVDIVNMTIQYHPGNLTVIESYPMEFAPLNASTRVEDRDRWTARIPHPGSGGYGRFQIIAEDTRGEEMTYPRNHFISIKIPGSSGKQLFINEFLAKNDKTNSDASGEFDDWLELFNASDSAIDLSGMYLSDDPDDLTRWQITDNITLGAGEYILFWCDKDEEQGTRHTNFKLDGDGEFIAITENDGVTIIDSVSFDIQTDDISYGRYPDAGDEWRFMTPSPEKTNAPTSMGNPNLLPESFAIRTYPNPFNGSLTFEYTLQKNSEVQLSIFNTLGAQVWQITQKNQAKGKHTIRWNALNQKQIPLSSGIYFYILAAGNQSLSGKILYLK